MSLLQPQTGWPTDFPVGGDPKAWNTGSNWTFSQENITVPLNSVLQIYWSQPFPGEHQSHFPGWMSCSSKILRSPVVGKILTFNKRKSGPMFSLSRFCFPNIWYISLSTWFWLSLLIKGLCVSLACLLERLSPMPLPSWKDLPIALNRAL